MSSAALSSDMIPGNPAWKGISPEGFTVRARSRPRSRPARAKGAAFSQSCSGLSAFWRTVFSLPAGRRPTRSQLVELAGERLQKRRVGARRDVVQFERVAQEVIQLRFGAPVGVAEQHDDVLERPARLDRVAEVGVVWINSPDSRVDPIRSSLSMLRDVILMRLRHRGRR